MSVVVGESSMSVPGSSCRAVRVGVEGAESWSVSWLPGRVFTRSQATTAMVLASTLSAGPVAGRAVRAVGWWAEELGLTCSEAADAYARAEQGAAEAPGEEGEWPRAVSSARESAGDWLGRGALPPGPEGDRIAQDALQANAEALARRTLSARERAAVRAALPEVPELVEVPVEEDQY
ncbi:MAG: hypothetical protein QG608_945 [Actinomycetota bacterium]|nr:hypothetical protein [Actinomycetota bacterium]